MFHRYVKGRGSGGGESPRHLEGHVEHKEGEDYKVIIQSTAVAG